MDSQLQESWEQLRQAVSVEQNVSAMTMAIYLLLGAVMSLYIRFLYRQCGSSPNDADSVTRVFPLLTMVTIGVIAVVKSSMALSLGWSGRCRSCVSEPPLKSPKSWCTCFCASGWLGAGSRPATVGDRVGGCGVRRCVDYALFDGRSPRTELVAHDYG